MMIVLISLVLLIGRLVCRERHNRDSAGKIVPRFDTLLDLVRVLDRDLLMIPRALVPAVQALIRDNRSHDRTAEADEGERPLYAADDEPAEDRGDET